MYISKTTTIWIFYRDELSKKIEVKFGATSFSLTISNNYPGHFEWHPIVKIYLHTFYMDFRDTHLREADTGYDIAMLRLETKLNFNDHIPYAPGTRIRPICLPVPGMMFKEDLPDADLVTVRNLATINDPKALVTEKCILMHHQFHPDEHQVKRYF